MLAALTASSSAIAQPLVECTTTLEPRRGERADAVDMEARHVRSPSGFHGISIPSSFGMAPPHGP